MLNTIRKRVASIFIKILLLLLVLSFVLWGVSDVFSPGREGDWLAKVGDTKITSTEYTRSYRQSLQRLSRTFGQPVSDEQARAFGLPGTVLNQLITQALLEEASADMGMTTSDDVIRKTIADDPSFRNDIDQFDATIFRQLLAANGMSEQEYVNILRGDIARNQLISAVSAVPGVPDLMSEQAFLYAHEKRIAQYVRVPEVPFSEIAEPDDATLRQFLDERKAQFTTPELRAVTAIILSAEHDIAPTIEVHEDAVRAAYEERIDDFSEPERRSFQQMVFPDEKTAQEALQRLSSGESFTTVAADMLGSTASTLELADVRANDLPPELAEVVFALETNQTSQPEQSPLGWHILKVTAVNPGQQTPLDAVADQLRAEIARDLAIEALIDRGNELDDILGSGATLEQAAGELGLKVQIYPAIDAQGRDASAAIIENLPEGFAAEAFKTEEGAQSLLTEASDNDFFVLRVDEVTPPALKDFETVRDDIRAAWKVQRRNELTRTRAEKMAEDITGGRSIAVVARESGFDLAETPALTRDAESEVSMPPEFIAVMFNAESLGTSFIAPDADGYYVGQLKEIIRADPAADTEGMTSVRNDLKEAIRNDIAQQYLTALRRKYSVELNQSALAQIM